MSNPDEQIEFSHDLLQFVNSLTFGLKVDVSKMRILSDVVLLKKGVDEGLASILLPVAEDAAYKAVSHPDYTKLAGRIEIKRLKATAPGSILYIIDSAPEAFTAEYLNFCVKYYAQLDQMIDFTRDDDFTFFGIRTLEKSYLLKDVKGNIIETPQFLYLRVATFLFMDDSTEGSGLDDIKEYYDLLSLGKYTHATPTLCNAGLRKGSLASCFILSMQDDLEKIFMCLGQCAMISKAMGGIGLDISNIRHSKIGFSGESSGIIPLLKVYNSTMRYVDQGGRRNGSATVFLQPWHVDIIDFIEAKRPHGKEERRAHDLFYSLWCCDIFMKRVKNDEIWSLFCPKTAKGLTETYGEEFDKLYEEYEQKKLFVRQLPARQVWTELILSQMEVGGPFICNKDTVNKTSNQKNLGLIRSSNLCQEIMEVTDETTISSCNLASIMLDEFVIDGKCSFESLGLVVRKVVRALNKVVDKTWYPLSENSMYGGSSKNGPIKSTNMRYKPLGIAVQSLANTFFKLKIAWESPEAKELNSNIFATIYYYALDESCEIAKVDGHYDGFIGSPASKGILKPDMMLEERKRKRKYMNDTTTQETFVWNKMYDWDQLKQKIMKYGLRNSLLVALAPTASTAQIRNKTEAFEPVSSNMYTRSVLAGTHIVVNEYLVKDLEELGMWTPNIINNINLNDGSVQNVPGLSQKLKDIYKTSFEIKQKRLAELSIDRQFFVDQSQSLNINMKTPTLAALTGLHLYTWFECLNTGIYYLHSSPSRNAIKFTVSKEGEAIIEKDEDEIKIDTIPEDDLGIEKESEKKINGKKVICTDEVCISCQS